MREFNSSSRSAARPSRCVAVNHFRRMPLVGSSLGCSGRNANRRRIAASTRAIDLSAKFIVPIMKTFFGKVKPLSSPEVEDQLVERLLSTDDLQPLVWLRAAFRMLAARQAPRRPSPG